MVSIESNWTHESSSQDFSSRFDFPVASTQTDPSLKVGSKTYSVTDLLKRPDIEDITVNSDPAYKGQEMHYKAIKAATLFQGTNIGEDEVIQVRCLDGFAAPISKDRIMGTGPRQSTAYIAIEDPKSKWPDLPSKEHSGTAGPFYRFYGEHSG
jgi:hypothetical protein